MEKYGAYGEKMLYGKKVSGVIRSTFIVGAKGTIERACYNVRADGHAAKVLARDCRASSRSGVAPSAGGARSPRRASRTNDDDDGPLRVVEVARDVMPVLPGGVTQTH